MKLVKFKQMIDEVETLYNKNETIKEFKQKKIEDLK